MRGFFGIVGFLMLLAAGSADAGAFDTAIKALAPVAYMADAEFETKTRQIEETPFGDKFLTFRVRIPSDWQTDISAAESEAQPSTEGGNLGKRLFGTVERFISPPRMDVISSFTLEALSLSFEIDAASWFQNYILGQGYTLEAMDVISDKKIEAIYVTVEKDTTYAVRVVAQINGPRMVLARYSVPSEVYADEKVMQAQVLKSFELLNTDQQTIETRKTYSIYDLSFVTYPESWKIRTPRVPDVDRSFVELLNSVSGKAVDGKIHIGMISRTMGTSLADEVKAFRKNLSVKGYTLGPMMEEVNLPASRDISFSKTQVYDLIPETSMMQRYEMWITVMQSDGFYYLSTLLTPHRKQETYTWTRNRRAYGIVIGSIRVNYDE